MSNKILITGATGNIGAALLKALSTEKANLRLLVRNEESDNAKKLIEQGYEVAIGDFSNIPSLLNAMKEIETLYLLVPSAPNMDELSNNAVNAAKQSGVKHIVKQSVLGADMNAMVDIPRLHGIADVYLKNSGIDYTIIQPNSFMQNFLGFINTIKQQSTIYANYADGKFSAIDVRDIAAVTAKAITTDKYKNEVLAITGPAAIDTSEVAAAISAAIEREIKYTPVSSEIAKSSMLQMGIPEWIAENLKAFGELFAAGRAGTVTNTVEEVTGNKAISIHQFANDFAGWFK